MTIEDETLLKNKIKRYELALKYSNISVFEYDILKDEVVLSQKTADYLGIQKLVSNVTTSVIRNGLLANIHEQEFKDMFTKVKDGDNMAFCSIYVENVDNEENAFDVTLVRLPSEDKSEQKAVGIIKDVTEFRMIEKEKEYGNTMNFNKILTYEANITKNEVLYLDNDFAKEFNIPIDISFSKLVEFFCEYVIENTFRGKFAHKMSREYIINSYENGNRQITLEYRKKCKDGKYEWFHKTVNIIKDTITNEINIRTYIININNSKLREVEEKKRYNAVISTVLFMYEVNFTQNKIIKGEDKIKELYGIDFCESYDENINTFCKDVIYPDDAKVYLEKYSRKNVIASYKMGETNIECCYRRPNENGEFIWVKSTLHLYEEVETNSLVGYAFIDDINEDKKNELELIYKDEHDLLTDCYNKESTREYITAFLESSEAKLSNHAFFIIDIDRFKEINDVGGHAFGDYVITKIAGKIHDLFRKMDIVGRIGGDEFVVFMENVGSENGAINKADELCKKLSSSYENNNVKLYVSVSIGISFYPFGGVTYDELYRNSDTALYLSKQNGRNKYTLFTEKMGNASDIIN
ncbi:MAG: GGDEF domain-containing protein [Clostridia bacterium]